MTFPPSPFFFPFRCFLFSFFFFSFLPFLTTRGLGQRNVVSDGVIHGVNSIPLFFFFFVDGAFFFLFLFSLFLFQPKRDDEIVGEEYQIENKSQPPLSPLFFFFDSFPFFFPFFPACDRQKKNTVIDRFAFGLFFSPCFSPFFFPPFPFPDPNKFIREGDC